MSPDYSRERDAELKSVMDAAMKALREAVPDHPLMCIIAFPTNDPEVTCICSGSNVPHDQQIHMLTIALEGQELNRHQTTIAH